MSSPESTPPEDFIAPDASEGILQRVAWRRKELLFLGCVLALVGGAIYYSQQPPVYQSSAEIVVDKEIGETVVTGQAPPWEDYVGTQVEVIKSPAVMDIAARLLTGSTITLKNSSEKIVGKIEKQDRDQIMVRLPDDTTDTILRSDIAEIAPPSAVFAGVNDAELAGRIKGGVTATRQTRDGIYNRVLYVSFRGGNPDECREILTSVIQGYAIFLRGRHQRINDKTVGDVTRVIDALKKSIEEKKKAYDAFLATRPLITPGDESFLVERRNQLAIDKLRRDGIATQVKELEDAIKQGKGAEVYRAMRGNLRIPSTTGGDMKLNDMIVDLTLKRHLMLAEWGEDHPDVQVLKRKIQFLEDFSRGKTVPEREKLPDPLTDPVRVHLEVLKRDLHEANLNLTNLEKQVKEAETRVKAQADFKMTEEHLRADRDQDKQRYEQIINRLEDLKLSKNLGGLKIDVIAPATAAFRVGPVAVKTFMASLALGLLLGALLAGAAELMDRGFHTIEEVRERLGLPVIGHIPIVEGQPVPRDAAPLESILCTYYQPKSIQAESFRGIRTWLYFTGRGDHYKVIQITSPQARDGKTTLAANLAVSMAQSGKKVVLLDADFRKPRVHQVFGVPSTVGLASVIAGTSSLKEATLPTAVEGLSVIPCGPRPRNPAELLTSPQFQHLLDSLRKEYDFVLLDTPPLLAVSDPSAVAPRVDGVLLVVRFSKYARPNARRAKELLASLRAQVLGVVVNGFGRTGSPFGYDGYQGYAYGYSDSGYYLEDEKANAGASRRTSHRPPPSEGGLLSRIFGWWRSPSS